MRFGAHVSIGRGLVQAAAFAAAVGCATFQIFSSNPRSWRIAPLDAAAVASFRAAYAAAGLQPLVLHTPYLINLAAADPVLLARSRAALQAALARADELGASYVVTHLGSHGGRGGEEGVQAVVASLGAVLQPTGKALLLLENAAGGGYQVGADFGELAAILQALPAHRERLGICLDTAHLWGAGYDLASPAAVQATLDQFDARVGMARLHLIHANDTEMPLGSHRDRHQFPGEGLIGHTGFQSLLQDPRLADLSIILEIPDVDEPAVCQAALGRLRSLAAGRQAQP